MNNPPYMTQLQRQQRRRMFAGLVANGQGCREVSEKWGVVEATVRLACREFGVIIRHRKYAKGKKRMGIYS